VIVLSDAAGSERITIRSAAGCEVALDPKANRVTVHADEVVVRGAGGMAQELATKTFVMAHTHPSAVGSTGPPAPLPPSPSPLTTVLKAE
jgi:hypothetical protein